jgi:hypothetical protein
MRVPASARRAEIAQRRREARLPDAGETDDAVVRQARGRRRSDARHRPVRQHLAEADEGEKHAAGIEAEMWRDRSHGPALRFNREVADYRQELIA